MTEFVHLHVHSDYSLTDAAVTVKALADRADKFGMTHLALTDHGNMFGAMAFIFACQYEDKKGHTKRKKPVIPIIGCEVYVSPGSRFEKKGAEHENKYYHMVLLSRNYTGYKNLIKICSLAYTEGFYYRPRIDNEILKSHHEGLIALSACVSGEIPRLILSGKSEEAEERALYYKNIFGNDEEGEPCFYLEIQDHGIPSGYLRESALSQKEINDELIKISKKTGIPLVATNDVHYLERDDYIAHDTLLCIGTGKNRSDEKRKKYFGDQFYFKTGDEMASLFSFCPEAVDNTVRIAKRCKPEIPKIGVKELPKYLPDFDIPPDFKSPEEYLKTLTMNGLEKRYPKQMAVNGDKWEEIKKRAEFELSVIIKMGFTGYFLIVEDFINYAKEKGIPVGPGRGSGAGSITAYALRITDINPLKYNLLFERFLNPDRISMPDFDIDFANEGREEVINYVTNKYGTDRVGQIITFGTLGAKGVISDVARTLGIDYSISKMITKLIDPKLSLDKAIKAEPRLKEYEEDDRYKEVFLLARKLEGLHRNQSIHAAGIVIGKYPLSDLIPLYQEPNDSKKSKSGGIATQYSMKYLEQCGLVKMDFLGLKTLDIIKNTEELVRQRGGKYSDFSVENVPENDKKTFNMLGEGNSFKVFQFESEGMQNSLKKTKPASIEDLIALNAMYRPGPMKHIQEFVECKNGRKDIEYPDPSLEKILKETYGVIAYQEQVMEVAKIIAGYSMGQADLLRRAMGKKEKDTIDKEKIPFIEGAVKRGYSEETAGKIYDILVPFADYGFNKSHAAAYSVIAYQTAYLKAHFPAEFIAANLTNEINTDTDALSECIDEARRMGIQVDPPDINHSNKVFSVVDGRIIFGFTGIKGLGDASASEIIKCREKGPYKSFIDFLDRVNIKTTHKKSIELLIKTGAFDSFGITRETLEGNLDRVVEYAVKKKEDELIGQTNLFDDASESVMPEFQFDEKPQMSRTEKLNIEKQLIGFYFSGHPMDEYKDLWKETVKIKLGQQDTYKTGNCILVGIIKTIKTIVTSKGSKMAFGTLADYNGEIEITFFSGVWEKLSNIIETDKIFILKGKIEHQKEKDKFSFIAEDILNRNDVKRTSKIISETEEKDKMHRVTWNYMADLKSSYIKKAQKGAYTIIGYLRKLRNHTDINQNEMAFGTLEDFEGEIDLVFFSKIFAECKHLLNLNEIIALKGRIDPEAEKNLDKISFKVSSIADYPQLSRSAARKEAAGEEPKIPSLREIKKEVKPEEVHIKLIKTENYNDDTLFELRDYLSQNSGKSKIFIHVPVTEGEKKIKTTWGIDIYANDKIMDELKKIKCVAEAWKI